MRARPSPGFGASPQRSHAGLGTCPLPGLVQTQTLLTALEERFRQLCPHHQHGELEGKGATDEGGSPWQK